MDPARYSLQQGWDNNSALEGYGAVHEPNFRVGSSYDERGFLDERYSRDNVYPRNTFQRENYPPLPTSLWPQSRRRDYEEEYSLDRESRQHQKPYIDAYHEVDTFHGHEIDSFQEFNNFHDGYLSIENYRDHGFDRPSRFGGCDRDDYDYRSCSSHKNKEDNRERDYNYNRHSYDSDYDRGNRRDGSWRQHESRGRECDKRCLSRERELSPHRRHECSRSRSCSCSRSHSRSQSRGHDDHPRSRSPRGRSHSRSHREDSYDDSRHERIEKRRERDEKRQREPYTVAPSATVVVKGLSRKTTEEDLYQILAEWGPLRHVRVIKERNSGVSRGFAFIDFPSVGVARAMMDRIGVDGLAVDGRRLFFEYSSKPTGSSGGPFGHENALRSGQNKHRSVTVPSDWMCTICGCVNFARRTSCFQCNEPRTDDAPPADINLSNLIPLGKRGSDAGPTHVLVVRGLDEYADEEMLRYEFSKHAPIKDLRLVRDKFTHVSRGFAFVHFHSVEDATKTLEATNGATLEKNGQILRVAYAKSVLGPGSGMPASSQSSSLAAAAIEAAAFSQQYDAVGWAPKEYNPDEKQSTGSQEQRGEGDAVQKDGSSLQSGFVWDEASGYYYDAASGFYYDGNTGLYYDGNSGIWYSYDHQTQQYIPCTNQNDSKTSGKESDSSKATDGSNYRKVIISAPAATITSMEKPTSLPDAVQAAAAAAIAAEKKGKEKLKEIKLASKSTIVANKKKVNNVTMWKQWSHDNQQSASAAEKPVSAGQFTKSKFKTDSTTTKEDNSLTSGAATAPAVPEVACLDSPVKPKPVSNSSGGTLMGVIRNSGRGFQLGSSGSPSKSSAGAALASINSDTTMAVTPFRTDASALGSYMPPVLAGSGKRRFSEMPVPPTQKEQPQTTYRDRAAERRSLYGLSSSVGNDLPNVGFVDSKRIVDSTPFPPEVGGRGITVENVQSYEVITADKAIDENNVGNRMLRNMGWHEGLGLGKDGSGMIEPVQAQAMDTRAGLGSQQKKLDPTLEMQAGDSYKTVIHKKALARFCEMS